VINPKSWCFIRRCPRHSVKELDQPRQGTPRPDQLRIGGSGQPQSSRHGNAEGDGRNRHAARSLQGHRARAHRPARGAGIADVQQHASVLPACEAGKLRGIASAAQALAAAPDIPTVAESGRAGIRYVTWYGPVSHRRPRPGTLFENQCRGDKKCSPRPSWAASCQSGRRAREQFA